MRWLIVALLLAAPERRPNRGEALLKLIEREMEISNLLAAGRLAWDAGDYSTAAARWDAVLRIEGLPADVERALKPFAAEARSRARQVKEEAPAAVEREPEKLVTLSGIVSGGGSLGPGGAVVTLRRTDGTTPKPAPLQRPLQQKEKRFAPHVLAVPLGSTIEFRNEDELFHDVFSLSPAAKFDTGLHKGGAQTLVKFDKPGVVELLCNIHASMRGYIVVVETPWYAVADAAGAFHIPAVPPGEYEAEVWHESSTLPQVRKITVAEGAQLAVTMTADKRADALPPDKYGNRRNQTDY